MEFKSYEYRIPSYYLSLIFNGDSSGLTDDDLTRWEEFEAFEDFHPHGHWEMPDDQAESYFATDNDVNNLGGDVIDLHYMVPVE